MRLAISPSQTKSDIENHVSHRRSGKDVVLKTRAVMEKNVKEKKERERETEGEGKTERRRRDDKEQRARGKVRSYEKVHHLSVFR